MESTLVVLCGVADRNKEQALITRAGIPCTNGVIQIVNAPFWIDPLHLRNPKALDRVPSAVIVMRNARMRVLAVGGGVCFRPAKSTAINFQGDQRTGELKNWGFVCESVSFLSSFFVPV